MMKIATCPNCGAELEQDECCDTDFVGNFYATYIIGHCPSCKKEFRWVEVYEYIGVDDIEEIT